MEATGTKGVMTAEESGEQRKMAFTPYPREGNSSSHQFGEEEESHENRMERRRRREQYSIHRDETDRCPETSGEGTGRDEDRNPTSNTEPSDEMIRETRVKLKSEATPSMERENDGGRNSVGNITRNDEVGTKCDGGRYPVKRTVPSDGMALRARKCDGGRYPIDSMSQEDGATVENDGGRHPIKRIVPSDGTALEARIKCDGGRYPIDDELLRDGATAESDGGRHPTKRTTPSDETALEAGVRCNGGRHPINDGSSEGGATMKNDKDGHSKKKTAPSDRMALEMRAEEDKEENPTEGTMSDDGTAPRTGMEHDATKNEEPSDGRTPGANKNYEEDEHITRVPDTGGTSEPEAEPDTSENPIGNSTRSDGTVTEREERSQHATGRAEGTLDAPDEGATTGGYCATLERGAEHEGEETMTNERGAKGSEHESQATNDKKRQAIDNATGSTKEGKVHGYWKRQWQIRRKKPSDDRETRHQGRQEPVENTERRLPSLVPPTHSLPLRKGGRKASETTAHWELLEEIGTTEGDGSQHTLGYFSRWHNVTNGREQVRATLSTTHRENASREGEATEQHCDEKIISSTKSGWCNVGKQTRQGITSIAAEIHMKINVYGTSTKKKQVEVEATAEVPRQSEERGGRNRIEKNGGRGKGRHLDREESKALYHRTYQIMKGVIRNERNGEATQEHEVPSNTETIVTPFETTNTSRATKRHTQNERRRDGNGNRRRTLARNPTKRISSSGEAEETPIEPSRREF